MADQQYLAAQDSLTALLYDDVLIAWALLDPGDLPGTLPHLEAAVAALVQQYGRMSATMAAQSYVRERRDAGIRGRYRPMPADPAGFDQVRVGVEWATKGLWSQEVRDAQAGLAAAEDVLAKAREATQAALTQVVGVAEKAVLDAGRDTKLNAVVTDRQATGWARVAEPGACSFCLMLVSRGAVYKQGSFDTSNAQFAGLGEFKAHNHCKCDLEPTFAGYQPSAEVKHLQDVWKKSTAGLSGKAARDAFRQATEGGQ